MPLRLSSRSKSISVTFYSQRSFFFFLYQKFFFVFINFFIKPVSFIFWLSSYYPLLFSFFSSIIALYCLYIVMESKCTLLHCKLEMNRFFKNINYLFVCICILPSNILFFITRPAMRPSEKCLGPERAWASTGREKSEKIERERAKPKKWNICHSN